MAAKSLACLNFHMKCICLSHLKLTVPSVQVIMLLKLVNVAYA